VTFTFEIEIKSVDWKQCTLEKMKYIHKDKMKVIWDDLQRLFFFNDFKIMM